MFLASYTTINIVLLLNFPSSLNAAVLNKGADKNTIGKSNSNDASSDMAKNQKHLDDYKDKEKNKFFNELESQTEAISKQFFGCSRDPYPLEESRDIPKFQIDLDKEPEKRWTELVNAKLDAMKQFANIFFKEGGETLFEHSVLSVVNMVHRSLPEEYRRELEGIAADAKVSVGLVTFLNMYYELTSLCTSIVLKGEDGQMYLGRNLDLGIVGGWNSKEHSWVIVDLLRPLIVKLDFIKNGNLLYSSVSYAGYIGITTAVKKGAFSLSVNQRFVLGGGSGGIIGWIMGDRSKSWLSTITRRAMEDAKTYEEAKKMLRDTPLVAPVYIILAGTTHQGTIITRDRHKANVQELSEAEKYQWFLVQTNSDVGKSMVFFDLRDYYASLCLSEIGFQRPMETLFRVLSTKPVLNKETSFTALMDINQGDLKVWVRQCEDPCYPF